MSTLREAAQQFVADYENGDLGDMKHYARALRAALAQQDEPLNLSDRAVQRRLAAQWGYVPAAQAEPVQEPVAWNWMLDGLPYGRACYGDPPDADLAERAATAGRTVRLLYTAPPQRKPLTEEEIVDAVREAEMESRKLERFAALVAAAEREACAALLEANGMRCGEESLSRLILETNAAAIRARNNT